MEKLANALKINLHPVFEYPDPYLLKCYNDEPVQEAVAPKKSNQNQANNEASEKINNIKNLNKLQHMQFINCRIDSFTMKLFCYNLACCRIETLKFVSNKFTQEEFEIL